MHNPGGVPLCYTSTEYIQHVTLLRCHANYVADTAVSVHGRPECTISTCVGLLKSNCTALCNSGSSDLVVLEDKTSQIQFHFWF